MDGASLAAGAICGVRQVRNPIRAARAVMEGGQAVLMAGAAADAYAQACGLEMVAPSYFTTERRIAALKSLKRGPRPHDPPRQRGGEARTVGAVARDARGHLAAATSTGGFNNKPVAA